MKHMRITAAIVGLVLLAFGCGSDPATPDEEGILNITMADFEFTPDKIDLESGTKVRVTLRNESADQDHGFMIGESVIRDGGAASGYEKDFFERVEVKVIGPAKQVVAGGALLTREGGGAAETIEGGNGFMVLIGPSSESTIIEFVVPPKYGEWEFASFEDDGTQYEDGMRGIMRVFPCTRAGAGTGSQNPSIGGRPGC